MKVVCVESFGSFITAGRTYDVVEENGNLYKVLDNIGVARYFNKSNFKGPEAKIYHGARGGGKAIDLRSSAEVRRESAIDHSMSVTDVILLTHMMQPTQVPRQEVVEVVQEKPRYVAPEPEYVPEPPRRDDSWFTPSSYDSGAPSSYDGGYSGSDSSSWD